MNKHELIGFFIAVYMKLKDLHKNEREKYESFFLCDMTQKKPN